MRLVVPCSTDATNTSPRSTNAISSPSGETDIPVAPLRSVDRTTALRRASEVTEIATRRGSSPGRTTNTPPFHP